MLAVLILSEWAALPFAAPVRLTLQPLILTPDQPSNLSLIITSSRKFPISPNPVSLPDKTLLAPLLHSTFHNSQFTVIHVIMINVCPPNQTAGHPTKAVE